MKKTIKEQLQVIPNELLVAAMWNQPEMSNKVPAVLGYSVPDLLNVLVMEDDEFVSYIEATGTSLDAERAERIAELESRRSGMSEVSYKTELSEIDANYSFDFETLKLLPTIRTNFLENCKAYEPYHVERLLDAYMKTYNVQKDHLSGVSCKVICRAGLVKMRNIQAETEFVLYNDDVASEIDEVMGRQNPLDLE